MRRLSQHNKEKGASIILFAVSLSAIFGFTGLAIDGGRLWVEKRNLVTATDSGALAGAHVVLDDGNGCDEAEDFVEDNSAEDTNISCTITGTNAAGVIEVVATSDVEYSFMKIFGGESKAIQSVTRVGWSADLPTGLRPFGVCRHADGGSFNNWLANPTYTYTMRVYFQDTVNACTSSGSAPGNWGAVDFDGGSNSNGEINNWIQNGYSGSIETSLDSSSCSVNPLGCYEGNPGTFSGSNSSALSSLQSSDQVFPFPVFAFGEGNGANFEMKMVGVASAKLVGYKVNGKQSDRYIDLQIQADGLLQWGSVANDVAINICATDTFDDC